MAAALRSVDWERVPAEELSSAAVALERVQAVLDSARLAVAGRLEATGAAASQGWASAKDFLTATAGGHKGAGSGQVRLARRLAELPATRAAMTAGWLSRAKAAVIATNLAKLPSAGDLRARAEIRLLEQARDLDATDLDRSFHAVVKELDPDGTLLGHQLSLPRAERAAHAARFLAFTADRYGGVKIRGYATAEEAELVKATLIPLAAPASTEPGACGGTPGVPITAEERAARRGCPDPGCAHDGRDPRDHGTRLWDALVEACTRLQTTTLLPTSHTVAPRLTVTVPYADLRDALDHSAGLLPGEVPLSVAAVRRLACDCELLPAVLGAEGQILDVGRSQRLVTPALWHALVLRDQHCAFPGCRRLPLACDAHHIIHWADGGPTSLDNLVLLCRAHHTLTHRSAWTVQLDPRTRRPVWTPPPRADDADRYTYQPPSPAPPGHAA